MLLAGGWGRNQEVSGVMPSWGGARGPKSDVQDVQGRPGSAVGPRSDVQICWGQEVDLYSVVQCIMGNGHMGHVSCGQNETDTTENITIPQLLWLVVITGVISSRLFATIICFHYSIKLWLDIANNNSAQFSFAA